MRQKRRDPDASMRLVAALIAAILVALALSLAITPARAATPKQNAINAIRAVFGKYASQAIRVAYCETGGTFSLNATNGQYRGLFQMGSWERATYSRGRYSTALDQTMAAWRYFAATGYDWSPWECKP